MAQHSYLLSITDEAETDIANGYCWYQEQAGLGSDFLLLIEQQLQYIEHFPLANAVVSHQIRRLVLPRFPYNIYYSINADYIDILAVWHGSQDQEQLLASRFNPEH